MTSTARAQNFVSMASNGNATFLAFIIGQENQAIINNLTARENHLNNTINRLSALSSLTPAQQNLLAVAEGRLTSVQNQLASPPPAPLTIKLENAITFYSNQQNVLIARLQSLQNAIPTNATQNRQLRSLVDKLTRQSAVDDNYILTFEQALGTASGSSTPAFKIHASSPRSVRSSRRR